MSIRVLTIDDDLAMAELLAVLLKASRGVSLERVLEGLGGEG